MAERQIVCKFFIWETETALVNVVYDFFHTVVRILFCSLLDIKS
jgi:hypothetical protein